jgi:hypothetical protein
MRPRACDLAAATLRRALVRLLAAPCDITDAGFLGDFDYKFAALIFGKPLDFKREAIGARDRWTVFVAINRQAIAYQDSMYCASAISA